MNSLGAAPLPIWGCLPPLTMEHWEGQPWVALILLHCSCYKADRNVSIHIKSGHLSIFPLSTWRYHSKVVNGGHASSALLGQKVLGVGLGEAGQHTLQACGIRPQWHPPMQEPLWMCAGQEREGMWEQQLAALLCLKRGRSFSTLWSCQPERRGLSLKSRGSGTVTQHGVQKMYTRQNMFPMLRKRKRKGLQEQWKYYTNDLSILYLSRL